MLRWRFLKQFPKFAVVFGVILISTALFWFWWRFQYSGSSGGSSGPDLEAVARQEHIEEVAKVIPSLEGNLLLADGDLYELNSGKLLVDDWFDDSLPTKLFLDRERGKIIAQYPNGLRRYELDGKLDAEIGSRYGIALNEKLDQAIFAKNGDIWKAGLDFDQFKLVDEEQVTLTAGFHEPSFLSNIVTWTGGVLGQRNLNHLLRINLDPSEVVSMANPISVLGASRSPNGRFVAGSEADNSGRVLTIYDVAEDETKSFPVKQNMVFSKLNWVNNERCIFFQRFEMNVFDFGGQGVRQILTLPSAPQGLAEPSPTGRYLFVVGGDGLYLVDLEGGDFETLPNPGQAYKWIDSDSFLFARNVPDTALRGTWRKQVGGEEVRVSTEPFSYTERSGMSVLGIPEAGMLFFASRGGMFKMPISGTKAEMFAPIPKPLTQFVYLEKWAH
jgi:hypothetical protein